MGFGERCNDIAAESVCQETMPNKVENAGTQHLFFPRCFLPFQKQFGKSKILSKGKDKSLILQ